MNRLGTRRHGFKEATVLSFRPRASREGFNEGWIDFESDSDEIVRGEVELSTVLSELVSRSI